MSGAELNKREFAFLLAVVNASRVAGLDDPGLFPQKAAEQEDTYGKGREQLVANGWLKLADGHTDEYELNGILVEMISVITSPEYLVVSMNGGGADQRQMVYHYLSEGNIVELSAPNSGNYQVGILPDDESLQDRIAEMLHVSGRRKPQQVELDSKAFNNLLKLAGKGEAEEAQSILDTVKLSAANAKSLLAALSDPEKGQIVMIRPNGGEIEAGRRTSVYGEADKAWLTWRQDAQSGKTAISTCNASSIGALLDEWMQELAQ
jgi:hypothetical protein